MRSSLSGAGWRRRQLLAAALLLSACAAEGEPASPAPVVPAIPTYQAEIAFARGSATLDPAARRQIEEAMRFYARYAPSLVVILGHALDEGTELESQRLSERRARAVADALIARGVPRAIIYTDGRGAREGRGRRVELMLR